MQNSESASKLFRGDSTGAPLVDFGRESEDSYDGDPAERKYEEIDKHNQLFRLQGHVLRKDEKIFPNFNVVLEKIKTSFDKYREEHSKPNKSTDKAHKISCFISYAWPVDELKEKESWVRKFVWRMGEWFDLMGFETHCDSRDSCAGTSMNLFMEKAKTDDFVIMICTESRVKKLKARTHHAVKIEEAHIEARRKCEMKKGSTKHSRVLPILLSGDIGKAVQPGWKGVISITEAKFSSSLPKLLAHLARIMLERFIEQEFNLDDSEDKKNFLNKFDKIWGDFYEQHECFKKVTPEVIEQLQELERSKKISAQNRSGRALVDKFSETFSGSSGAAAASSSLPFSGALSSVDPEQVLMNQIEACYKDYTLDRVFKIKDQQVSTDFKYQALELKKAQCAGFLSLDEGWDRVLSIKECDIWNLPSASTAQFSQVIETTETTQKIILYGDPGSGKSTWSRYICKAFYQGKLWSDKFDCVIRIPLRDLQSKFKKIKSNGGERILFSTVLNQLLYLSPEVNEACVRNLLAHKTVLWVLDGYDELNFTGTESAFMSLISELLNQKCVLVTSRSACVKNPLATDVEEGGIREFQADKVICLRGFEPSVQKAFVQDYFNCLDEPESVCERGGLFGASETKDVVSVLTPKSNVSSSSEESLSPGLDYLSTHFWKYSWLITLSRNPVLLEMLCYLTHIETQGISESKDELEYNRITSIYRKAVDAYTLRWFKKFKLDKKAWSETLQFKKVTSDIQSIIQFYATLALKTFEAGPIISSDTIYEVYKDCFIEEDIEEIDESLLKTLLSDFGLVQSVTDQKDPLERDYSFVHLSFHEYFAAFGLVGQFEQAVLDSNPAIIQNWFKAHLFDKRYLLIIEFVCGLYDDKNILLEALQSSGFDLNRKVDLNDVEKGNILMLFLENHALSAALIIAQTEIDLMAKDANGATAAHHAAKSAHLDMLIYTVSKLGKSSVTAVDKEGRNLAHYAAEQGCVDVLKYLKDFNVDFGALDTLLQMTPMHIAAQEGQLPAFELLAADPGVGLSALAGDWSVAHIAAYNKQLSILKLLNKRDESKSLLSARTENNATPAYLAVSVGFVEGVEFLWKHAPASFDFKGDSGKYNAIEKAAVGGHVAVLTALKNKNAPLKKPNNRGQTLLHLAVTHRKLLVVKFLIEEVGLSYEKEDNEGHSPLYYACSDPLCEEIKNYLSQPRKPSQYAKKQAVHSFRTFASNSSGATDSSAGVDDNLVGSSDRISVCSVEKPKEKKVSKSSSSLCAIL